MPDLCQYAKSNDPEVLDHLTEGDRTYAQFVDRASKWATERGVTAR